MKQCVIVDGKCLQCGASSDRDDALRQCPFVVNLSSCAAAAFTESGPGSELKNLLSMFGFEPTPICACRAKAAEMDAWGCDECSKPERIEEVVAVMREEAKARGLPFLDVAGRLLIALAISNARRKAQN